MALWLRTDPEIYTYVRPVRGNAFRTSEIIILLGHDFKIIELLSDDIMAICDCPIELTFNELATTILNRVVYGPALIMSPWEYFKDDDEN